MAEKRGASGLSAYNTIFKANDELYRGVARRCGLGECAFWVLYILRTEQGGLTQSQVCEQLSQPKQTVHSALKQLEAEGAIRLEAGPDRRSKRLALTAAGARLARETVDRVIAAEERAMLALTEDEQAAFLRLFRQYTDALQKEFGETL